MKTFFALLLITTSLYAAPKHVVMVSDSRGNCAFAAEMRKNFFSQEGTSFRIISAGGSAPRHWMSKSLRWVSPLGHNSRGDSDSVPAKIPMSFKLDKIRTPYFPELLKSEKRDQEKMLTIINLGTNEQDIKLLKKNAIEMIKEVQKVGSSCAWVTPPHAARFPLKLIQAQTDAITEAIELAGPDQSGERCQLIKSLDITHYPFDYRTAGIDGVHYCWNPKLIEAGHKWADDSV